MFRQAVLVAGLGMLIVSPLAAQGKKSGGPKMVMNDITVTADTVYTGTVEMGVDKGQVTGKLHLTAPEEIVADVAGTSKAGVMSLEFPYRMTRRDCTGTVKMTITVPPKPGPAKGTMEAIGCGRDASQKLLGTVELIPVAPKKK